MAESYQDRLKRVRPPRVKIDYKVETEGAEPLLELPFVVGVMADLSGAAKEENKKGYKQRRFVPIDRDNFNDVMARSAPRAAFRVADKVSGKPDSLLNVELNFKNLKDFDPARVAEQVPVLNDLLTMRKKLTELLSKMEGNDALEKLLSDVMASTEKRDAVLAALGKKEGDAPASQEEKS
ncbi:MAG: type VI secretion system contractile sheath small subunit [Planctomycetes bacterium]|nr:type VI secretion system contractile sheath small subunit [Planctomycetota bacterium]